MKCLFIALLLFVTPGAIVAAGEDDADTRWEFRVLLDGSEIGSHEFTLQDDGDARLLHSEARFAVKFLFFTAYRYRHTCTETWRGGCVRELQAETVTNGKTQTVSGSQGEEAFVVRRKDETEALAPCVMTFAYWNPVFLKQSRLLNPQTGEYLAVDVRELPAESLMVRGESVMATRYRVTAKGVEVDLWYSSDDRWLALESPAKGGRTLRYELI